MSEQGDEISLVKQFKEGDERAFNEIVRTYQERLYYLALKLLGDREDAQDISQEAFVKAYYGLNKFKEDSSLYTWLYRIVLNLCMNRRRRDKLVEFVSLDVLTRLIHKLRLKNEFDLRIKGNWIFERCKATASGKASLEY